MARKAAWILVLLVGLLVLSVSAVFAASATRPAQASITPKQEIGAMGKSSGTLGTIRYHDSGRGNCPVDSDSAAAY